MQQILLRNGPDLSGTWIFYKDDNMRISKLALAVVALTAMGTVSASADSFKRIKTEQEFNSIVVGKKLSWGGGTAVVQANGKTTGKLNKQGKYSGNWKFTKGFYCRNLVISGKETGTNCQTVEVSGNQLRLTRDQGKGSETILSMK